MKKLVLVILAGISFATANAQFQIGAKGGLNVASLGGSDADGSKSLVNIYLGAYARLPITGNWSLQPELVYSAQGAKFENPDFSAHVNYLNIPILLRYAVGEGFAVYTGPQIGFLLSAHDKAGGNSFDRSYNYNSGDFSWALGLSYHIPATKLGIDARYNFGIANIEDRQHTGSTGSLRNNVFQLGVTYTLFSVGR